MIKTTETAHGRKVEVFTHEATGVRYEIKKLDGAWILYEIGKAHSGVPPYRRRRSLSETRGKLIDIVDRSMNLLDHYTCPCGNCPA